MRKSVLAILVSALVISLPLAAQASSSKKAAVIVCADTTPPAVAVVAVSESANAPVVTVGTDCAVALVTLAGGGLKIVSTVAVGASWVYTLTSSSGD